MIKASALYMSVIVSLVIVLICGSILMLSSLNGIKYQSHSRSLRLQENMYSGLQIVLSKNFPADSSITKCLYEDSGDSVFLSRRSWGIYEIGEVTSWINRDTLKMSFLIGTSPEDSIKVFYLADEDRPMSISGTSLIKGTAYLPKAGIKAAYVNGFAYKERKLVFGITKDSQRNLPDLDLVKLEMLKKLIADGQRPIQSMLFLRDSALTISLDFKGENALLVAKCITIPDNFSGQLQAIATDSIIVGNNVKLRYPSALVIIKNDTAEFQTQIKVGANCDISGQIINYEHKRSQLMPVVSVGEHSMISGEIWSKGYVNLGKGSSVSGVVSAIRLMARVEGGLYENYLIDVRLDISTRSKYYLSSQLINTKSIKDNILCWIN